MQTELWVRVHEVVTLILKKISFLFFLFLFSFTHFLSTHKRLGEYKYKFICIQERIRRMGAT